MNLLQRITVLILCIAFSEYAFASSKAIRSLESDIKSYESQKTTLDQELKYTQSKLKQAHKELANLQVENKTKEIQLEKMKSSIGKRPTAEQKEFISNENRRLELGETAIKSRRAAVTRLERKQRGITKDIARAEKMTQGARNRIAELEDNQRDNVRAERTAATYKMRRELEELKKENEQLRIAMAEEARRTREANTEAKRLEELAKEKELALQVIAAEKARKETEARQLAAEQLKIKQASENAKNANIVDQSQIALPGEKPIYKRSDGKRVVIRNRGKKSSSIMKPVGENIYEAEVVLEPGKSYFDVRKRRYRGYFPESLGVNTYIFSYDLSDKRRPKLDVRLKQEAPNQMISNAKDPF